MSLRQSSFIALRCLRRNRLQTLLTIASLMIGVGTLLATVAVGIGAQSSITSQVQAAGMNIILIHSGNFRAAREWRNSQIEDQPDNPLKNPAFTMQDDPEMLGGKGAATTLSLDDAAAIRALPKVQAVSAAMHDTMMATAGSATWVPQVRGEQAALIEIRRAWVLRHGRFFTAQEEAQSAPVAVLGSVAADHLFGTRNPVGESIALHGQSFRVIGVIASGSWMVPASQGDGQFDAIYLPAGTAQRLFGRTWLDDITLSTVSTGDVSVIVKEVQRFLRERHHLDKTMAADFTVMSQADQTITKGEAGRGDWARAIMDNAVSLDHVTLAQLGKKLETTGRTMSWLLASIAAVSLVVGGIGIMNIMLLSVTERTHEIGIRRAVGAQSGDVMEQFLIEAVLLSGCGGLLGIALGMVAAAMIAHMAHWATELSWPAIALSFTISTAIGVLFGFYPARQASRVDPMTALRYE
ncbi:MAG TPA: ABC transporter permease [Granulicella sp.]